MSFIEQLQKRNVMRVAIVYGITGWVLAQVMEYATETFGAPEWVLKIFTVGILLGFPLALILAWAFEMTPQGIKRAADVTPDDEAAKGKGRKIDFVIIGVLAIALAISIVTRQWGPEDDAAGIVAAPTAALTSVAVLPFLNMSNDPENEFFSDGISEELLNVLVKVEGLRVPSRTSSFAFKGVEKSLGEIASELEVDHILEGSVRKSGNTVRVTAQLIDVNTDTHLWSESYDRELTDIFAIQDDIASSIVAALQEALGTGASVGTTQSTDNLEAYELYLQARHLWRQRQTESIRNSIELFKQALELDPGFAKAWSNLAAAYVVLPGYDRESDVDADARAARDSANRALEIDPGIAEAYAVLGFVNQYDDDFVGMFENVEKALALDPTDTTIRLWYGIALLETGYFDEALEQITIAQRADPASGLHNGWMVRAMLQQGRLDEAHRYADRAWELGRMAVLRTKLVIYFTEGDYAGAIAHASEHAEDLGELADAMPLIVSAVEDPGQMSALNDAIGDSHWLDAGIGWFLARHPERTYDAMEGGYSVNRSIILFPQLPYGDFLREDPRFQEFMTTAGVVELWEERGWPDQCRPVGDSFECD